MTRAAPRRRGFVVGLIVFASLSLLTLSIYPMLSAAGAGVRTEGLSLARWRARAVALSGLKVAGNVLHRGRPYPGAPPCADDTSIVPFQTGQQTSAELGIREDQGTFVIFYENAIGAPRPGEGGCERLLPLHHVDVFVRGTSGDDSAVAYGAFLSFPTAALSGTSTDGYAGAGATSKRLVRIMTVLDPDLQDVTSLAVRDAIRTRVKDQGAAYLANYARIDFDADPATLPVGSDEAAARDFLGRFLRTPPADHDPAAIFARDRLHDVVFEGTAAAGRATALWRRRLDTGIQDCTGNPLLALAEDFCGRVASCTWQEPACLTPDAWDLAPEDPPGTSALHLLHEQNDGTPDAGYLGRIRVTPPIQRSYDFGCAETFLPETPPEDMPGDVFLFSDPVAGGQRWCTGVYASVSEPVGRYNYEVVEDLDGPGPGQEATGVRGSVHELLEFFRRFHSLDEGEPVDDAVQRGFVRSADPGPGEDDGGSDDGGDDAGTDGGSPGGGGTAGSSDGGDGSSDDGGSDGGSQGGGGGTFGGGFSG